MTLSGRVGMSAAAGRFTVDRRRARAALALAVLAVGMGSPVAAAAAGTTTVKVRTATTAVNVPGTTSAVNVPGTTSPFSPGVPVTPLSTTSSTTTAAVTSTSTTGSGGLSGTDAILIAVGALVVLIGVSFFIWRDARRHAPVKQGTDPVSLDGGRRATKATPKPRKLSPAERKRRKRGRAR